MARLWLISAGVSDLQFPLWKKNEFGAWTGPMRAEIGGKGIRQLHEGLLTLQERGQLHLSPELPKPLDRQEARDLNSVLVLEGETFFASFEHKTPARRDDYQISQFGEAIPNTHEPRLPLYCAKVQPLLNVAKELFEDEPITVVVLNTRRDAAANQDEPVAVGPLIARFVADALALEWRDNGGRVPDKLPGKVSTWVDILIDRERVEDQAAQDNVVARLNGIIRAWHTGEGPELGIAVTTTGGMGQLKPIIERLPATWLGQSRVKVLQQTERGAPTTNAVDYESQWTEREALRFHCVEALRQRDYVGAYGIASRYETPWRKAIRRSLGPLLQLPPHNKGFRIETGDARMERPLHPHELHACQIEACLCGGDAAGAILLLGVFIEAAIWELIETSARIRDLRLTVHRIEERLRGDWPGETFKPLLDPDDYEPSAFRLRHIQKELSWARWLKPEGVAGQKLFDITQAYNNRTPGERDSIHDFRNRLSHGAGADIDLDKFRGKAIERGLITGMGQPFGANFLAVPMVSTFLTERGAADLGTAIRNQLDALLNTIMGG